jgi:hypothetical protein
MASTVYKNGRVAEKRGDVDLINNDIIALLIDTDQYTPDFDNDVSQNDIPIGARLIEVSLTGNTLDGDIFRADDLQVTGLMSGNVGAVVIIQNADTLLDTILLAYLEAPELPIVADGTPINFQWDVVKGIYS